MRRMIRICGVLLIGLLSACATDNDASVQPVDLPTAETPPTALNADRIAIDPESVTLTADAAVPDTVELITYESPVQQVYFLRQTPPDGERASMEALINGQLALVGECLRILDEASGTAYLVIWPPGYTLNNSLEAVQNADAVSVAAIGDSITLSGGEIPESAQAAYEAEHAALPVEACPGPYWVAGA